MANAECVVKRSVQGLSLAIDKKSTVPFGCLGHSYFPTRWGRISVVVLCLSVRVSPLQRYTYLRFHKTVEYRNKELPGYNMNQPRLARMPADWLPPTVCGFLTPPCTFVRFPQNAGCHYTKRLNCCNFLLSQAHRHLRHLMRMPRGS